MRKTHTLFLLLVLGAAGCAWPALARQGAPLTPNQVAGCWAYRTELREGQGQASGTDTVLLAPRPLPSDADGPPGVHLALRDPHDLPEMTVSKVPLYWFVNADSLVVSLGDMFSTETLVLRASSARTLEGALRIYSDDVGAPVPVWNVRAERVHCPPALTQGAA